MFQGGTLLLDEVDDLLKKLHVKLLRVLVARRSSCHKYRLLGPGFDISDRLGDAT
jgi:hypothetical protein